ncbi:oxysterol-binding -related 3-like isoform X1 [Labeo rohita]|uniref:Oxysterol-binding-related 3-like isoform X1 n=1 Tax=Labeo rohita TaxID=84645 RepID=A0A498NP36_LABRO|nr:oxysterol-binding -related 3-like isoform X1 [Labeo rohita]
MSSEEKSSTMSQKISSPSHSNSSSSSKHDSRQDSWEIVEGLRGGLSNVQEPEKQSGYMLKKRKWPMKGWHKRYFYLDKGILKYAKCAADVEKGKLHGCIDVGLSVMAIKKKAKCIDLDAEENIYHLKIKSQELFDEWVSKLRHHRLYRQNEIAMFPPEKALFHPHYPLTSSPTIPDSQSIRKQSSLHSPVSFTSQAKVTAWLQSSDDMDRCTKELSVCEAQLLELNHLLRSMEVLHRTYSAPAINALQASTYDSPKKEKRHPRKWRPKNYGKDNKTTLQVPSCISAGSIRLHASNPNLSSVDLTNDKTYHEPLDSPIDVSKLQEDFYRVANNLHTTMKSALCMLTTEKERLKQMLEHESCPAPSAQLLGLKNALTSAVTQNAELRERLCKIHAESHISEPSVHINLSPGPLQKQDSSDGSRPLVHQASNESRASITESLSEFFDAQEVLLSASSSENEPSEDDSYISDISDNVSMDNFSNEVENERGCVENGGSQEQRRSCLPSPSPNTSTISLWNILKNNIGKDLSKVAMPVQLNEPLNTLQRLCEELEYSELLDKAAHTQDPFERMVYIATFAVSGYASSYYRAGGKPFNPVLGETYECDRPDKGFRFVAEQAKYWNSSMNEVEGAVTDHKGKVVHKLFGKWHEGMYCGSPPSATCIWRTNPMPPDYEQYYGFTKFAMELNELDPLTKPLLPPTDTRLRLDQRLLEEGNIESAEVQKQRIEQLQRERRRVLEENHMAHQPRFFQKSKDDTWVSNNTYWDLRKDPGFSNLDCPVLW